jgi:ABC-2 type transport system permease protein
VHKLRQRYRYSAILLKQLVKTDFKLRYQGSVLGYVWSLLRPLLLFVILYIVFAKFLKVGDGIEHYPQYLLLGIVLWNYFSEVTTGSVGAIVGDSDLIRKINFPKYVIILAGSFSAFINLLLNFIVLGFFMYLGGVVITWHALWLLPLIAELFIFSLALAFILSALFVRYRDVLYIWEVIMQAAFYATPILYPLTLIPDKAAKLLILNPMAQIIQDARYVLITPQTETIHTLYDGDRWIWAIPLGIVAVLSVSAVVYFRKQSKYFAEEV